MTRAVPSGGRDDLGHREHLAVAPVEAQRQVAGQLDVLRWSSPTGTCVGPVEQDVGRHQRRIGEQRDPGRVHAAALLLELDHPVQLAGGGHALQQVGELRVRRHVALPEQRGPVEAERQEQRRRLVGVLPQQARVVLGGHRVQVGDAVEGVVLALRHRRAARRGRLPSVSRPDGVSRERVRVMGVLLVSEVPTGDDRKSTNGRPWAAVGECVLGSGSAVRRATTGIGRSCAPCAQPLPGDRRAR